MFLASVWPGPGTFFRHDSFAPPGIFRDRNRHRLRLRALADRAHPPERRLISVAAHAVARGSGQAGCPAAITARETRNTASPVVEVKSATRSFSGMMACRAVMSGADLVRTW